MADKEKVKKGLDICKTGRCIDELGNSCPYSRVKRCSFVVVEDALELLKEQEKEIKALRLLVDLATDCELFEPFPDEYERYKDDNKGMKYIDWMIHVAKRTLEERGAFET